MGPVATIKSSLTRLHVHSSPFGLKKLLILSVNGVFCYFPPSVVLQRYARMFGRNVDKAKMEVITKMEDFHVKAFEKFYTAIWSCMKPEDVLEVFLMFMLKNFVDQSIFIRGCGQCSKMASQISPRSHYCVKDLKRIYYGCHGLPYGKEDQTLLIDDEPSKAFQNSKWNGLFLESFKGQMLSKNKV